MKFLVPLFILFSCTLTVKAQLNFSVRDTTLQVGESIPQFCIQNNSSSINALNLDDRYSSVLDLGFTFNFFGNDYTQCVVSDNLQLSFNTSLANAVAIYNWTSTGMYANRFPNSIFPALMDLILANGGKMQFAYSGQPGSKKFILEWCGVPKYGFNCNNDEVSIQVVLHEGTNIIDINTLLINGSSTCPTTNTSNKGIQGITNIDNSTALFTPGRGINDMWGNTGITNNTVRFIPSGSGYTIDQSSAFLYEPIFINDSFTNVSWYSSLGGAVVATGACIDIPYDTAIDYYVAQYSNYQSCDDSLRNFSDTIWVHSVPDSSTRVADVQAASKGRIRVYPNPAGSMKELKIKSEKHKINKVSIINAMGLTMSHHTVANEPQQPYTLSIGNYPTGIYLLVIETSGGIYSERISIN